MSAITPRASPMSRTSAGSVFAWLDEVRKTPGMYVTDGSLRGLETLIYGYYAALHTHGRIEKVPQMTDHFSTWLSVETGWSMSCGWAHAIISCSGRPPLDAPNGVVVREELAQQALVTRLPVLDQLWDVVDRVHQLRDLLALASAQAVLSGPTESTREQRRPSEHFEASGQVRLGRKHHGSLAHSTPVLARAVAHERPPEENAWRG